MSVHPGDAAGSAAAALPTSSCPDCRGPLAATGGCRVCLRCGYSPCG